MWKLIFVFIGLSIYSCLKIRMVFKGILEIHADHEHLSGFTPILFVEIASLDSILFSFYTYYSHKRVLECTQILHIFVHY